VSALEDACSRLEELGVTFHKKLTDGRMKNIAFALDPDGYWVELIGQEKLAKSKTDIADYRFNHTMFRIKDPKVSLKCVPPVTIADEILRGSNWNGARSKI
jgi:lactoylglutathione lyase